MGKFFADESWYSDCANLRLHGHELPSAQTQTPKGKWKLVIIRVRGVDFSNWRNGWSHPCSGILNSSLLSVYPGHGSKQRGGGRRRLARSGRPGVHAPSWLLASLEDSSSDWWFFGPEVAFAISGVSWALVIVSFTFQHGLNNKSHRAPSAPPLPRCHSYQIPKLAFSLRCSSEKNLCVH